MRYFTLAATFLCLLILTGCTKEIRVYNIETGEMFTFLAHYNGTGKGKITANLPSGEVLQGEWVLIRKMAVGWGSIYSTVYTPNGPVSGSGSSMMIAGGGQEYGTAFGRGDRGTIFDCELVVGSNNHGTGACKDNHGQKYKMMF